MAMILNMKKKQKNLSHIKITQPLAFTEAGTKYENEDNIYPPLGIVTHQDTLFMVCDGIGGLGGGNLASSSVCRSVPTYLLNHANSSFDVSLFNKALLYAYNELDKVSKYEIGTTLAFLKILDDSVFIAHLGDSKVYHIRPCEYEEESILFQTKEHSLVNELLDKGKLTRREARDFGLNDTLTKAIQSHCKERYTASIYQTADIQSGDYFFLCSDGVLEYVTNARLRHILCSKACDVDKMAQIQSICRNKSTDNYSAYLIRITESKLSIIDDKVGELLELNAKSISNKIDLNRLKREDTELHPNKVEDTIFQHLELNQKESQILIGAIAGDIIGSYYEFFPMKSTDFQLFTDSSHFTDDTIMTVANADWLLTGDSLLGIMQDYGNRYPSSYGSMFYAWLRADNPQPYNSWGNGSAMRVSPVGWAFKTLEETLKAAKQSAEVTHNHPEGIKGAQATAACIYLARTGKSKQEIKEYIETSFGYNLSRTCDEIRTTYCFNESCQGTVPESIIAFLESTDFENAIRLTISLNGDADTMGAITGGIAEAYYKEVPEYIKKEVLKRLPDEFIGIMHKFCKMVRNNLNSI